MRLLAPKSSRPIRPTPSRAAPKGSGASPTNPRTHPKSHQLRKPTQNRGRQPALTNLNRNQSPRRNTRQGRFSAVTAGKQARVSTCAPAGNSCGNTLAQQNAFAKPSQQKRSRDTNGAVPSRTQILPTRPTNHKPSRAQRKRCKPRQIRESILKATNSENQLRAAGVSLR